MKLLDFATLSFNGKTPINDFFQDIYYNLKNGFDESTHVYLNGNALPQRFIDWDNSPANNDNFVIGEIGFGTGLNFFNTADTFLNTTQHGTLFYIAFELQPLQLNDLKTLHYNWLRPELRETFYKLYPHNRAGFHRLQIHPRLTLLLVFGDIKDTLPQLNASVNAWFLDGFNPSQNPDCFSVDTLTMMAQKSAANATVATFSAARVVRDNLTAAGFNVEKTKGYNKREMVRAVLQQPSVIPPHWTNLPPKFPSQRKIAIIGGGISGSATAYRLAPQHQVVLFNDSTPASAVPVAIPYLQLDALDTPMRRYHLQAWHAAQRFYSSVPSDCFRPTAMKNHAINTAELMAFNECLGTNEFVQNGVVYSPNLLNYLQKNIETRNERAKITATANAWLVNGDLFDVVIIATGWQTDLLDEVLQRAMRPVRGQGSTATSSVALHDIHCLEKTLIPISETTIYSGGSFYPNNHDLTHYPIDDEVNLAAIRAFLPHAQVDFQSAFMGIRGATRDYFPMVGAVADVQDVITKYTKMRQDVKAQKPKNINYLNGLFVNLGLGSKAYTHSFLNADILAAMINGEPLPIPQNLLPHLLPTRFILKALSRRQI